MCASILLSWLQSAAKGSFRFRTPTLLTCLQCLSVQKYCFAKKIYLFTHFHTVPEQRSVGEIIKLKWIPQNWHTEGSYWVNYCVAYPSFTEHHFMLCIVLGAKIWSHIGKSERGWEIGRTGNEGNLQLPDSLPYWKIPSCICNSLL